jgi:tRNA A37 methylthiotransferase MiaB
MMREVFSINREKYQSRFLGKRAHVLWERSKKVERGWMLDGLTDNYLRVQVVAEKDLRNEITTVKLKELGDDRIRAEVVF